MKRIPCRVVRSVPFDRGGGVSRAGGCSDIGLGEGGIDLVRAEFLFSSDSGNWTFGADGAKVPFVELDAGIALDFVA